MHSPWNGTFSMSLADRISHGRKHQDSYILAFNATSPGGGLFVYHVEVELQSQKVDIVASSTNRVYDTTFQAAI